MAQIPDRQTILNEIIRTARQNGNRPVGEKTFSQETGISPYYRRRYWATYGAACREAGYEPNMPYTRHPAGFLETEFINLARKLNKYPTMGEMQVENTENPAFPVTAIKKKQIEFVRDIMNFCRNTPGNDDIMKYCQPVLEKLNRKESSESADGLTSKPGDVYLLRQQNRKLYKIGFSYDLQRRSKELARNMPEQLVEIHSFTTDDPSGLETYWKTRFKLKLVNGTREWYRLDSRDIKSFKRWTKLY
jgi:hypothetical protein